MEVSTVLPVDLRNKEWFFGLYRSLKSDFLSWSVFSYNLSEEDAKDLYQETFVCFWKNIQAGKLKELSCDPKTYVYSIGKHIILNFIRKHDRVVPFSMEGMEPSEAPFEISHQHEHNRFLVREYLDKIPPLERKILELYYFEGMDMASIARELGYKNADVAKKKKYEVFRKLTTLVKSNLTLIKFR